MFRTLTSILLMLALGLVGCNSSTSPVTVNTAGQPTGRIAQVSSVTSTIFYLHGSGGYNNPPTLFLDATAPTDTQAKYRDSAGVHFSGGNPWAEVGVWEADAAQVEGLLTNLADLHIWCGLKTSDDQGTHFDVRAEVWQDYDTGPLAGWGEIYNITGITRNPSLAKEIVVAFSDVTSTNFDGTTNLLQLRILARIGTDGNGNFAGGHASATGLRVYFDSVTRLANFGVMVQRFGLDPGPWPTFYQNFQRTSVNSSIRGPQTTPTVQWSTSVGIAWTPVISSSNIVYTAGGGGYLTAVDGTSGSILWSFASNSGFGQAPTIAVDGTIYAGTIKKLHALNPDGTEKWSLTAVHPFSAPIILSSTGAILVPVYVGPGQWYLYSITPDGQVEWQVDYGFRIEHLALSPDEQTIYAMSGGYHWLTAIDANTGQWLWEYHPSDTLISTTMPVVGSDGTIYLCGWFSSVHALNPDGSVRWQTSLGISTIPYLLLVENRIYLVRGGDTSYVACLDADTGNTVWIQEYNQIHPTGFVAADDSSLYIPCNQEIYALNQSNGNIRWSSSAGTDQNYFVIIGADSSLYTGRYNLTKLQ